MLIRSSIIISLAAMITICSCGCANFRKKKEKPALVARQPAFVGTVALVNLESQFVLIDNGLLPTPPPGLALKSYTEGVVSAELQSSVAQRRPFTIADIRQGTPRKGDRVFVATSTVLPAQSVSQPQPHAPAANPAPSPEPDFLPPVQFSPAP